MGTFVEFYKIRKEDVPKSFFPVKVDVYENEDCTDETFFDLSIDQEEDVLHLKTFPRTGQLRVVLDAFMPTQGLTGTVYNTSMVTSRSFISAFLSFVKTTDLWNPNAVNYSEGEREMVVDTIEEFLNRTDFDNEFLFYTYY
mgnify:CR=1 FL=1